MASSVDLLINVIANTGSAQSAVDKLIQSVGTAAGIGAGTAVFGEFTKTSMDFQDAMARVQTAYNSTDFAPGTAAYQQAQKTIADMSTRLATPFEELATTYGQGARFVDEFGNKLPTGKIEEYTETVARLAKVSSDNLSADELGRYVETFEKITGNTNFGALGSAISALSGVHNLGEGPVLQGAIGIASVSSELGVNQGQALGVSNFLVDRGAAAGMAGGPGATGSSIGRMLLRMDASADSILDPEEPFKKVKAHREASERLDDLQDQLAVAQQKHAEAFGQHGLKKQFRQHPSEMMAMDQHIAKLQREIADQHTDMAHADDTAATPRGAMNLAAMAATAGKDANAFAELDKTNPMEALIEFTEGLHNLPESQRGAAIRRAGLTNSRDQKTIELLATAPDALRKQIDLATGQLEDPTDLATRSDIPLGTTSSKVTNVTNAARAEVAAVGDGPRQAIDAAADKLLAGFHDNNAAINKLNDTLSGNPLLGIITTGVISGVTTALPIIATRVLTAQPSGTVPIGAAGPAPIGTPGPVGVGNFVGAGLNVGGLLLADQLGKQLANGLEDLLHANHLPSLKDLLQTGEGQANQPPDTRPSQLIMKIDAVHAGSQSAEQVFEAIKQQFVAAWTAAMAHQPVSGQVGGNFTSGQGPH